MTNASVGRRVSAWGAILGGSLVGCHDADAPKAWSAFSACLAGPAAAAPPVERVQKLRMALLASAGTKGADAWPARCNRYAETLYAATGDVALLHRALKERLACADEGAHCALPTDETFLPTASALWDAAQAGQLKA